MVIGAAFVLGACGSPQVDESPAAQESPTAEGVAQDGSSGKFSSETPPGFLVSPQEIYEQEKELCSLFTVKEIAKDYGVAADPIAAAEAVAEGYQPPFQQAAFEGCLDGTEKGP